MGDNQETKPDSEHINLKVTGSDNSEVHFKIKRTTQLKKLMNAYCDRQGIPHGTVRFLYDGERLSEEMTPKMLEMEDEDQIEVLQEQTGGM